MSAERYFFVHLQKTAGTALLKRLRFCFGDDRVYPLRAEQGTPETVLDVGRLVRRLADEPDRFTVVTGHFPLATLDHLEGQWRTFTVLRDPVERVLSFLRHQSEVDPAFEGVKIEQIYESPIATGPLVANHMVNMLSGRPVEANAAAVAGDPPDRDDLVAARRNLEARVDVVGVQEHFEAFCETLAGRFGFDLGPSVFMNRTTPVDASAGLRRRIEADNHLDVELYEYARELVGL